MDTTKERAERLALGVLVQVEDVAEFGLAECYETYYHSLYDLFPDFPWDRKGFEMALEWMIEQPRLKAASDAILAKGGPDYLAMFKQAQSREDVSAQTDDPLLKRDPRWGQKAWRIDPRPYSEKRKALLDQEMPK